MAPSFETYLEYDRPTALLEPAYERGRVRDILLVIDWEEQTISAETRDPSTVTTTESRWRGREDAYTLPPLVDATRLRAWVAEEVLPRATPLLNAYELVYVDIDAYGQFPGHESEKVEFDRWMTVEAAPPLHDGGIRAVADWLAGDSCGVRADTSDKQLKAIAGGILISADQECVVLVGGEPAVMEHLNEIREEAQDILEYIPEYITVRIYRRDRDRLTAKMKYGETIADRIQEILDIYEGRK